MEERSNLAELADIVGQARSAYESNRHIELSKTTSDTLERIRNSLEASDEFARENLTILRTLATRLDNLRDTSLKSTNEPTRGVADAARQLWASERRESDLLAKLKDPSLSESERSSLEVQLSMVRRGLPLGRTTLKIQRAMAGDSAAVDRWIAMVEYRTLEFIVGINFIFVERLWSEDFLQQLQMKQVSEAGRAYIGSIKKGMSLEHGPLKSVENITIEAGKLILDKIGILVLLLEWKQKLQARRFETDADLDILVELEPFSKKVLAALELTNSMLRLEEETQRYRSAKGR